MNAPEKVSLAVLALLLFSGGAVLNAFGWAALLVVPWVGACLFSVVLRARQPHKPLREYPAKLCANTIIVVVVALSLSWLGAWPFARDYFGVRAVHGYRVEERENGGGHSYYDDYDNVQTAHWFGSVVLYLFAAMYFAVVVAVTGLTGWACYGKTGFALFSYRSEVNPPWRDTKAAL